MTDLRDFPDDATVALVHPDFPKQRLKVPARRARLLVNQGWEQPQVDAELPGQVGAEPEPGIGHLPPPPEPLDGIADPPTEG